MPVVK